MGLKALEQYIRSGMPPLSKPSQNLDLPNLRKWAYEQAENYVARGTYPASPVIADIVTVADQIMGYITTGSPLHDTDKEMD